MNLKLIIFGIIMLAMLLDLILFVVFGQKAIRKLRKNQDTKDALGIEFLSGWDIVNVATALSVPRKFNRFLRGSSFSAFNADADLLEKYLSRFDVILGRVFFNLWVAWVLALFLLMLLDNIGVFK